MRKPSKDIKTNAHRIAQSLTFWMKNAGLTDVNLAKRLDMPRTTLRTYLSGRLTTLNLEKIEQIALALGKTLPELLTESEYLRGYFKSEVPSGKFEIINLDKYKVRLNLESPLNPHHAHGWLYFSPGGEFVKRSASDTDIWLYLKSEGGIITLDYNGETKDIKSGERIVFNARHPFSLKYFTDARNKRKLQVTHETDQQIVCSFSSSPPFWLY